MSEIKINFDKWDDAIDDISNHILDIYDKRIDFLSDVQNSISGLPGDYGYKWPAHGDVGNSKNDVENKKNDLIRFRDTLRNTYDYVKNEEENLAQRLYSDSNSFMHANGIQPEYEKSAFQKFCEGIANGVKDAISVIADAIVWLWDSGIIQLVGEILIAAAAVAAFVLCFPVSGVMGVLTAIGLGWGAAKALVDVYGSVRQVASYASGDEEAAKKWADYDMKTLFNDVGEGLNDYFGVEFCDEIGDVLFIGLDTVEFVTGITEFGKGWKSKLNTSTSLNTQGLNPNKFKFAKEGDAWSYATNILNKKGKVIGVQYVSEFGEVAKYHLPPIDYNSIKNVKKIGKTIMDFPEKGAASFLNLVSDSKVPQGFKNFDKLVSFADDPLSITLSGLNENGVINDNTSSTIKNAYKGVKAARDVGKSIITTGYAASAGTGFIINPSGVPSAVTTVGSVMTGISATASNGVGAGTTIGNIINGTSADKPTLAGHLIDTYLR